MDAQANAGYSGYRGARRTFAMAGMLAAWPLAVTAAPASTSWTLGADAWAVPRQAEALLGMPPVAAAVRALLVSSQSQLVLTHAAGEEGSLWGSELRDWLVSLGIDPKRIRLQPTSSAASQLTLSVTPAGRSSP